MSKTSLYLFIALAGVVPVFTGCSTGGMGIL